MALDQRVDRLERALTDLAGAQARTERMLAALVERVDRVEVALTRLAEAQARTEQTVRALAQQLGRLSDVVGFTLEDLARELTPAYLAQHCGIHVAALERRFFLISSTGR